MREEREGEAEEGGEQADDDGERQAVPEHAAASPAGKARQLPDVARREALGEGDERDAALRPERRRAENLGNREEDEERDGGDHEGDGEDDEDVAAHGAAAGKPGGEEIEEHERGDERAITEPGLRVDRRQQGGKQREVPAVQADREALDAEPAEPDGRRRRSGSRWPRGRHAAG